MIISCENCSKKFNIQDNLISDKGRLLQCGICSYKWFFNPNIQQNNENNEVSNNLKDKNDISFDIEKIKSKDQAIVKSKNNKINTVVKKNPKIIKISLVLIISFIAIIIILDTFKHQISIYFPDINSILNNLYETLKDLSLFFTDLIR